MKLEITEIKLVCGCCLEKTGAEIKILSNQDGALMLELVDAQGKDQPLILHIRFVESKTEQAEQTQTPVLVVQPSRPQKQRPAAKSEA
jgi:hypothetical protein